MTSTLATVHPDYEEQRCAWMRIRDSYKGQEHIKKLGVDYLPPTTGMAKLTAGGAYQWSKDGLLKYCNYKMRALFPGDMAEMVRTAIGILWNKDATIEVPKKLEYIKEEATSEGDTILQLMRDINVEQLLVGRCGLLADLPTRVRRQAARPYFTMYKAEKILNWDIGSRGLVPYRQLNHVVLDESENERQADLSYSYVEKYLVLSIGNLDPNDTDGFYYYGRFRGVPDVGGNGAITGGAGSPLFTSAGMKKAAMNLPFLPFVFINSTHINPRMEAPPHIDLADLIVSLYQNSANLEQQIHEQSQETLVIPGGASDVDYAIGVGAVLTPPINGDAKFIGIDGKGLPEAQKHYQNKRIQIERRSGQMIDTRSLQRESGESLKTRLAAQTATLSMIAKACGWGMTRGLKHMAVMVGADPNEVKVKPNVNFLNPELFAKTLVELMQAKSMGLPVTNKDLILMMQDRGITSDDVATVLAELKSEPPSHVLPGLPVGNPGGGAEPTVVEGESVKLAAKTKAANPTGASARGTVRNSKKKASSK
jgi:hypothetical protein